MVTKKKHLTIYDRETAHDRETVAVLDMGPMEIWDGADLALLRETLTELIEDQRRCTIAVDLTYVKYIPSGFFGMLYDWNEKGVTIFLDSPQPNVKNMLWFRQFFQHVADECHRLQRDPKEELSPTPLRGWNQAPPRNGSHHGASQSQKASSVSTAAQE